MQNKIITAYDFVIMDQINLYMDYSYDDRPVKPPLNIIVTLDRLKEIMKPGGILAISFDRHKNDELDLGCTNSYMDKYFQKVDYDICRDCVKKINSLKVIFEIGNYCDFYVRMD